MANPRDLTIDPDTCEIVLTGGTPTFTEGAAALAQSIRTRLRFVKGEWFLDLDAGVDFLGRVLGKRPREVALAEIRRVIAETPGVASILSLEADLDRAARKLTVRFTVSTDYGALRGTTEVAT